jgi:hypothetical protein
VSSSNTRVILSAVEGPLYRSVRNVSNQADQSGKPPPTKARRVLDFADPHFVSI